MAATKALPELCPACDLSIEAFHQVWAPRLELESAISANAEAVAIFRRSLRQWIRDIREEHEAVVAFDLKHGTVYQPPCQTGEKKKSKCEGCQVLRGFARRERNIGKYLVKD